MKIIEPFNYDKKEVNIKKAKGYITKSIYITVYDGTKLATDIHLPKNSNKGERIPAVLIQTRYWRSYKFRIPLKWFMKEPRKPKIVKGFT
ncbi:MAG: hypothetical protein ACTSYZ_11905 [Candidatus Helarchaeota archaeon]